MRRTKPSDRQPLLPWEEPARREIDIPAKPSIFPVLPPRRTRRKASGGVLSFYPQNQRDRERPPLRAIAFIDGQNLFHAARRAFGYTYPSYEPQALARAVCDSQSWQVGQVRFYTGVPGAQDDAFWHHFWVHKLAAMGRVGIHTVSRRLRYRLMKVALPGQAALRFRAGEEKGIDVRIAIDLIRLAHRGVYDVALIFSQDQDLAEAGDEIRVIGAEQGRDIIVASAFPTSPAVDDRRGINRTRWLPISRAMYDACQDRRDYRPLQ